MTLLTPSVCCFNLSLEGCRINEVLLQVYNLSLPFLHNQASSFLFSCLPASTLLPSSMQPSKKEGNRRKPNSFWGRCLLIIHMLGTIKEYIQNKPSYQSAWPTPDRTIRCSHEVQQQLPGFRPSLERGESDAVERTFLPTKDRTMDKRLSLALILSALWCHEKGQK